MKLRKIVAGVFAIAGLWWAMGLILTMLVPPIGIMINLYFLPGWLIYVGWWRILYSQPVKFSPRIFWLLSALLHLAYYGLSHTDIGLTSMDADLSRNWWLVVAGISCICIVPKNVAEQVEASDS